jgi:hypothetical protein
MNPAGLGTKNDCAGEDQQQFISTDLQWVVLARLAVIMTASAAEPETKCMSYIQVSEVKVSLSTYISEKKKKSHRK